MDVTAAVCGLGRPSGLGLLSQRETFALLSALATARVVGQHSAASAEFLTTTEALAGEPPGATLRLLDLAAALQAAAAAASRQSAPALGGGGAPHIFALASSLQDLCAQHTGARLEHVFAFVSETDVKLASRHERTARGLLGDTSLTYSEVSLQPLLACLREARAGCGSLGPAAPGGAAGCLVDAGSGAGRAVIAAALAQDFECCRGIEILEGLHMIATEAARRYDALARGGDFARHAALLRALRACASAGDAGALELLALLPEAPPPPATVYFSLGSFLEPALPRAGRAAPGLPAEPADAPWPLAADVLFANSTCFPEVPMLRRIALLMGEFAREGAVAVTLTRPLNHLHPCLEPLAATRVPLAWGEATLYLHRVARGEGGEGGGGGGGGGGTFARDFSTLSAVAGGPASAAQAAALAAALDLGAA